MSKYSVLSTVEYGSGRVVLFCSRFDNVFTGNNEQSPDFCRSCLQWAADKTSEDLLSVLTVCNDTDDGGYRVFDLADKVNVQRGEIDDLSNPSFIGKFDVVCLFGVDNNISPLIILSLKNYINSGGGLILSDIHVEADGIDLLDDISPVYCESAGFNFPVGRGKWTAVGIANPIYDRDFSNPKIYVLNTIADYDFDPSWDLLYIYDTSTAVEDYEEETEEVEGSVYLSSDYDISGDRIVGYFSGIYKKGIFKVSENE